MSIMWNHSSGSLNRFSFSNKCLLLNRKAESEKYKIPPLGSGGFVIKEVVSVCSFSLMLSAYVLF